MKHDAPLGYRPANPRYKPVSSAHIERWLGTEQVELISERMRGWQGPPVAVANIPGFVYACGDGDFAGKMLCGSEASLHQKLLDDLKRKTRRNRERLGRISKQLGGFTSLSDLISEATTGGKKQTLPFQKVGITAPAVGSSQFLWRQGVTPAAGSNAAAAGAGTAFTSASTGSMGQTDAASGDTLHFVNGFALSNQAQGSSLMLCDYLYGVNINYNTTSNTVTGVPTRYTTASTIPGNFQSGNVTTALGATAQNVTTTYTNQASASQTSPALAIRVSAAVDTIPHTAPTWYIPLAAGDTGIKAYTNISFSAANSGNVDRGIWHPIAIVPGINVANQPAFVDGLNTSFNLERIYDGACLCWLEWFKSATTAATYTGQIVMVSG
jgi:hypothetical protein